MDWWRKLSYSLKPHTRQTARARLLAASLHRPTPVIGFMQPHSLDKTRTVRGSKPRMAGMPSGRMVNDPTTYPLGRAATPLRLWDLTVAST